MTTRIPADNLPPTSGIDYSQTPVRSSRGMPQARAHRSVLVSPVKEPVIGDLATRAKTERTGGDWLADQLADYSSRALECAVARRNGEHVRDYDAEAYSFAAIKDLPALQKELDFNVTVTPRDRSGKIVTGERAVTTSAFALVSSTMATLDLMVAMESVPTVVEKLVSDIDDVQLNTEVPGLDDFGHVNMPCEAKATAIKKKIWQAKNKWIFCCKKARTIRVITFVRPEK